MGGTSGSRRVSIVKNGMKEQSKRTSARAVASLVLGIASLLLLGFIAGLPAVICGHVSLSNMKRDPLLSGRRMAITGLVTGYLGTACSVVAIAVLVVGLIGASQSAAPFIYTLF